MRLSWLIVIGAGPGDLSLLTLQAYQCLEKAQVLVGREDFIQRFAHSKVTVALPNKVSDMLQLLGELHRQYGEVALLLSGDPTFFSLIKCLPSEWIKEVIPGVSVFQYFCSRIGISWDRLSLFNLHATEDLSQLIFLLEEGRGGLVLSGDAQKTGEVLAIIHHFRPLSEIVVGSDLSLPGEKIIKGKIEEVRNQLDDRRFHIIYLAPCPPSGIAFIEDQEFLRDKVPLTKKETRMLLVSALELTPGMQVLEVGSGAGGLTIEIARRLSGGLLFAVERDEYALFFLRENLKRFKITNVRPIKGEAPKAIPQEAYHRVFIGGSGGHLPAILEQSFSYLNKGGIIAFTALTLETLEEGVHTMEKIAVENLEVVEQSITRFEKRAGRRMAHSLNSIFVVWGKKI